jgi:Ca2+-binding EF-hand superfamily protein
MSLMGMGKIRPPNAAKMSEKIIDKRDTDGDGALSIEEFGFSEDKFKAADADGDGLISQDELLAQINEQLRSRIENPMIMGDFKPDPGKIYQNILSKKDENGDGALNSSELNISEEMFAAIDTNKDGVIGSEEFDAYITEKINSMGPSSMKAGRMPDANRMAGRIMKNKDEDEDEQLSSSEADLSENSFSEIDTNRDGYISQAELTAWFTKITDDQKDLFNLMA